MHNAYTNVLSEMSDSSPCGIVCCFEPQVKLNNKGGYCEDLTGQTKLQSIVVHWSSIIQRVFYNWLK